MCWGNFQFNGDTVYILFVLCYRKKKKVIISHSTSVSIPSCLEVRVALLMSGMEPRYWLFPCRKSKRPWSTQVRPKLEHVQGYELSPGQLTDLKFAACCVFSYIPAGFSCRHSLYSMGCVSLRGR